MKTANLPLHFPHNAAITKFSQERTLTESAPGYSTQRGPNSTTITEKYMSDISWIDSKASCPEVSYRIYLYITMEKCCVNPTASGHSNYHCLIDFELFSTITYSSDYLSGFIELLTPPGYPMPTHEVENMIFESVLTGTNSERNNLEIFLNTSSSGIKESQIGDIFKIEEFLPLGVNILDDNLIIDVNYISEEFLFEDLFGYLHDPNNTDTLTSLKIIPDQIDRVYKTMCPTLVVIDNLIDSILRNK